MQENPQLPPSQVGDALGGAVHALSQAPQCDTLVLVSTHWPLQSAKPALHENPQLPPLHLAEALAGAVQALLHEPQCSGSESRLTHSPLQFVCPDPQVEVQVPLEQTWAGPQAVPQAPQWLVLV